MKRKIIFITGSDHSGKSRLGHMLATYDDCLYNYASISPQEFFLENNGLLSKPRDETLKLLKQYINKLSYLVSGGISHHDGKPWMRGDKLIGYDNNKFSHNLCKSITVDMDVGDFYLLWDRNLQKCRVNGDKSKFTLFEIEGVEGTNYVNLIKKSFHRQFSYLY